MGGVKKEICFSGPSILEWNKYTQKGTVIMFGRSGGYQLRRALSVLLLALVLSVLPAGADDGGVLLSGPFSGQGIAAAAETGETEAAVERGWHTTKNGKYYYYILKNGERAKGWRKIGSRTYYFNEKGYRLTGFQKISRKLYYFSKKGVLRSGWITVKGKKYYADPANGCALATRFKTIGNDTYYFLKKTGEMRTSGWIRYGENRYYFLANGKMAKGWVTIGKKTYYFRKKTGVRAKGWLKIKGYYYYFTDKGTPLKNQFTPDGRYVDVNGKRLRRSTLKKFLQTALKPVGSTLYVWGGGWGTSDTSSGPDAVTIGCSSQWKRFFQQNDSSYNYNYTRYQTRNGLDCSGFVGWTIYNAFNTKSGNAGYVCLAQDMTRVFSGKGWGSYTPSYAVQNYRAGDIMSSSGHVYIVIGGCSDGSVVLVHSSPPGVQITGTATRSGNYNSEAIRLANSYMRKCYPAWTARYPDSSRGPSYLSGYSQMRWYLTGNHMMTDPDGYRNKNAASVLADLLG